MATNSSAKGQKKELKVSQATQSLWLVKLPKGVADLWDNTQPGDDLGSLSIVPTNEGGVQKNEINITLRTNGNTTVADQYTLADAPTSTQLVPFQCDTSTNQYSVTGKISKMYHLRPRGTDHYRQVCRERLVGASTKSQETKRGDPTKIHTGIPQAHEIDFIPPTYITNKRKAEAEGGSTKRGKGAEGKEEGRAKLLQAFAKATTGRLTRKELNSVCQLGEAELTELLKKYTTYHSKGIFKNYYEIKPEYKDVRQTEAANTDKSSTS